MPVRNPGNQASCSTSSSAVPDLDLGICVTTSTGTYGYFRWIKAFRRSRSGASRDLTPSALTSATMTSPTSSWTSAMSSRSEEHTSELQSHLNLVCRLLLEKKKKILQRITCVLKKLQLAHY